MPTHPPLWKATAVGHAPGIAALREVPPVPPENNHAPPTPAYGTPVQRG